MPSQLRRASSPAWMRYWLLAAGAYNLVWGAVVIALPHLLFDLAGIERMRYPEIWQCVGMIVGVYGIGYQDSAHRRLSITPRFYRRAGVAACAISSISR